MYTPTGDWLGCKKVCLQSPYGLSCWVAELTQKYSVVTCDWRPHPAEKLEAVPFSITQNGTSLPGSVNKINPNTHHSWTLPRDPKTDSVVIVDAGGISATLTIGATPIVKQVVTQRILVVSGKIGCENNYDCMGVHPRGHDVEKISPEGQCTVQIEMRQLPTGMIMQSPMRWKVLSVENGKADDFELTVVPHVGSLVRVCGRVTTAADRRAIVELEADYESRATKQ